MDYITVIEAGEKWGISSRTASYYCQNNKIKGAFKKGNVWLIPADAKPPDGMRCKPQPAIRQPAKKLRETICIPAPLQKKLQAIKLHPLTIVTGPSGIGKTTAVDEFCKTVKHQADTYWYTCLGEPLAQVWQGVCQIVRQFDEKAAESLVQLGYPKIDELGELACILRDSVCKKEIFLVMDNYQYVIRSITDKLVDLVSLNLPAGLHLIVITQNDFLPANRTPQNDKIHFIREDSFLFSKEDIYQFFQNSEIKLKGEQLDYLLSTSRGWVSALKLERSHFSGTGTFLGTRAIEPLIQSMIWSRIDAQQQEFLLAASLMEGFNLSQAKILSGCDKLPDKIRRMIRENSFIRHIPETDAYVMHQLLSCFVQGIFEKQSSDLTDKLWRRAGAAFAHEEKYFRAAQCFFHIPDYPAILSLPYTKNDFDFYGSAEVSRLLRDIITACPEEILSEIPRKVLVSAFLMLVNRDFRPLADKVFRVMDRVFDRTEELGIGETDERELRGVTALLKGFLGFNDIYEIGAGYKKAYELLKGPLPDSYVKHLWVFEQPSVLYLYWRKPGELQHTLEGYAQSAPSFQGLVPHRAVGAYQAIQAEAHLMLGNDADAEILCHRSLYYAASTDCSYVYYAAELTVSRIAILRGDYAMLTQSLENMRKYQLANDSQKHKRVYEVATSFIMMLLGDDSISPVLTSTQRITTDFSSLSVPFAFIVHSKWMLLNRKYSKLLGLLDIFTKGAQQGNFLLPQIYFAIFRAVSLHQLGRRDEAKAALENALALAAPDKVYMPFAEHADLIATLLSAGTEKVYKEDLLKIRTLHHTFREGVAKINERLFENPPGLTKREWEVAALAKEGLSNRQIAKALCISDETVKMFLKHIFFKLKLTSRIQLQYMDF